VEVAAGIKLRIDHHLAGSVDVTEFAANANHRHAVGNISSFVKLRIDDHLGVLVDIAPTPIYQHRRQAAAKTAPANFATAAAAEKLEVKSYAGFTLRAPPQDIPYQAFGALQQGLEAGQVSEMTADAEKGYLVMGGNKAELRPEKPFAEEIDIESFGPFEPESFPAHHKNFFDSIRGAAKPNANIDLAIRVQTVISLAEMSERLSIMCRFDEKTRKITDGSGKVQFNSSVSGESSTWGKSMSPTNYQQVLSNSMVDLTSSLLKDSTFVKSLSI